MKLKEKYYRVIEYFEATIPVAETELLYNDPFSLLVAVILSAQCTDKRVNIITLPLLKKYPNAASMAKAKQEDIFNFIKSCSYPNNKARNLSAMARALMDNYNGIVPSDINDLMTLPGVGRKTANVIASVIFNKPVMAVDTHVFRVAARLGLTRNARTPLEAERQLTENIPAELMHKAHHWLILHGRYVCRSRKPDCSKCGLSAICNWYKRQEKP